MTTSVVVEPLPGLTITLTTEDGVARKGKRRGHDHSIVTNRPDGTYGTRRPRTHEEREMVADTEQMRVVLQSPDFWHAARCLPGNARKPGSHGRPAHYPSWAFLLVAVVTAITGSKRGAIAFFSDPLQWQILRAVANECRPAGFDPAPEQAPKRHHMTYFEKKWKSDIWAVIRYNCHQAFRGIALHLAQHMGHLRDDSPFRYDRPDRSQWIQFDGTVYEGPSSKRKVRGKPAKRVDPACGWHNKFGEADVRVWGTKVVFASTRSDDYRGRVILDYSHVVGSKTKSGIGDEGAAIVTVTRRIKKAAPGLRGCIVDGVLRDAHITPLAAEDVLVVNRPAAARNPSRKTRGTNNQDRVEKNAKVTVHRHPRANGTMCEHHIWNIGSVFHERVLTGVDADGIDTYEFAPLPVRTAQKRRNADGSMRHYLLVSVECPHGNSDVRVPLYHSDHDSPQFTRGELLRYYPTNSWQFGFLYGRRNDTESLHSNIKRGMRRMPAYGVEAQSLFLLAYSITNNAVARHLALQRQASP